MKLFEKYPKLRQKAYVTSMITESVIANMALEDRHVPEEKVKAIVTSLLRENALRGRKFDS